MNLNNYISAFIACASLVAAGTVNIPLKGTRTNVAHFQRHEQLLARRMSETRLQNMLTYYELELEIGTPVQTISFVIDTGTSDTWVMDASNPYCSTSSRDIENGDSINCTENPVTFKFKDSSTFNGDEDKPFEWIYPPFNPASGYYATDDIQFGEGTLENAVFALVTETNASRPVLGLGPIAGEASVTNFTEDGKPVNTYDNIPALLKEQGLIDSAAYSLWLNDLNAAEGQLLFGGVDHSKYVGTLQLVPMVPPQVITDETEEEYPGTRELQYNQEAVVPAIMLHSLYLYNGEGKTGRVASLSVPAVLDSSASNSYVPLDIFDAIKDSMNASLHYGLDAYVVECDLEGGFAFDFSGVIITIPFSQFSLPVNGGDMVSLDGNNGKQLCLLPLERSYGNTFVLGDVILRSMYCVFDNDNHQVAIANTRFNVTDSNVESIKDSIPSASSAPSYSSTSFAEISSATSLAKGDYTSELSLVTTSNVGTGTVAGRPVPAVTTCVVEGSTGCDFGPRPTTSRSSRSSGRLSRSTSSRSTSRHLTSRSSRVRSSRILSSFARSSGIQVTIIRSSPAPSASTTAEANEEATAAIDVDAASTEIGSASEPPQGSEPLSASAAASGSASGSASATEQGNSGSAVGVGLLLAFPLAVFMLL